MKKKSVMWEYIAEEPAILNRILSSGEIQKIAQKLGEKMEAVYFVAHGSSYNAAVAVSDFISRYSGVRVYAYTPMNFQYNNYSIERENQEKILVVAISQTGTSSGVIHALRNASEAGFCTLGITAVPSSPVAEISDDVIFLDCGKEDSNAKTKGYTATLMILLLLGIYLGYTRKIINAHKKELLLEELKGQISEMPVIETRIFQWCQRQRFGNALKNVYVLGYGLNYGTAMEGQLKLMETECIPTMFNDIGEFSHGMHRAITEESSVLLLKTGCPLQNLAEETYQYLRKVTEKVYILDASGKSGKDENRLALPVYPLTESLLLMTLAIQIFSVFAPEQEGKDPNRNANDEFTKVVHTRM